MNKNYEGKKFQIWIEIETIPEGSNDPDKVNVLVKTDLPEEMDIPTLEYEVTDKFLDRLGEEKDPIAKCVIEVEGEKRTVYELDNVILLHLISVKINSLVDEFEDEDEDEDKETKLTLLS